MEIEIDYTKSAQDNAQDYFAKSKEAKRKQEGAEQAIDRLEKKVKELERTKTVEKKMRKLEERAWYEKFYWFFTSDGMLAIGGRSAQQNEEAVSKYMDSSDLFFHANVFGASAVILKNGANASSAAKEEAAQFAACFSKAWEGAGTSADVFAVKKDQVSKSSKAGYLSTGGFLISGEREWFRNVRLELCAFMAEVKADSGSSASKLSVAPRISCDRMGTKGIALTPGKTRKSEAAAAISKKLGYQDIDYVMQHLPPGEFHISL